METTTDTTYLLKGCTDCLMLIANGDTSGNSRCETEEDEASYLAAVARQTEGLYLCPGEWEAPSRYVYADDVDEYREALALAFSGELEASGFSFDLDGVTVTGWTETDRYYGADRDGHFTYDGCDVCGSPLGGDKYPIAAWPEAA